MAVVVSPLQWAQLQDIDDVEPLNDSDSACLAELRDVLKRHDRLERFGVALLHSHFEMAEDEILIETSDETSRTLTLRPANAAEAEERGIGTVWMLRDGAPQTMTACKLVCIPQIGRSHKHTDKHEKDR